MSTTLAQLQQQMQHCIVSRTSDHSDFASTSNDAAERLAIYSTAYRLRLQDALAHNFPMLHQLLGEQRFIALAERYLADHPSTHTSVRSFGLHLSSWLQRICPAEPWIAEFARFEWALGDAFDAPDDSTIDVATLAAIDPDHWPQLQFEFARAVQRITLITNAAELYAQVSREEAVSQGCVTQQRNEWLIWREDLCGRYRAIDGIEALALDVLRRGKTFAQMCEELFDRYESESIAMQAAALLKRWTMDQLIAGVRFSS